eukprot:COSAG06_NODE_47844_length_336_cov_1.042194_1_plen_62_part_01
MDHWRRDEEIDGLSWRNPGRYRDFDRAPVRCLHHNDCACRRTRRARHFHHSLLVLVLVLVLV